MMTTPGITAKKFCACPLGTEGELTAGDDSLNPYEDPDAAEEVARVERMEREREDDQAFKTGTGDGRSTGGVDHPMHSNTRVNDPTEGSDPFAFDDIGPGSFDLPEFELGVTLDPFEAGGPQF